MKLDEVTALFGLGERVSFAAQASREALRQEFIEIRLDLTTIIRQAKKSHHPDLAGDSSKFLEIDAAARYLASEDLEVLVASILPESRCLNALGFQIPGSIHPNALTARWCMICHGTGKFRRSTCLSCGGRGTVAC